MTAMVGMVVGAVVGLGLFAVLIGAWGPASMPFPTAPPISRADARRLGLIWGAGLLAGLFGWYATGWPVGGLLIGLGTAVAPSVFGAKAQRRAAVARIEAIASWAEQLRDVMSAADGIQSAIQVTAPTAPQPIRPEVRRLADRLSQRVPLGEALERFADELSHPLADMIVTSLVLSTDRQGRLGDLLSQVALSARQTASMRMRVEAVRARTYVTTRLIIGVTIGLTTWLVVMNRSYLEPFDGAAGQGMLAVIGCIFAGSAAAMQKMARPQEAPRLLVPGLEDRS